MNFIPRAYRTFAKNKKMAKNILLTLDDVSTQISGNNYDSVKSSRGRNEENYNLGLLARCEHSWNSKDNFRKERGRVLQYLFGNQWGDVINYRGMKMTEEQFIRMKNNTPLKNNVLFSLYNSITGIHAKQETEPVCFARSEQFSNLADMMSSALQTSWQNTYMPDLCDSVFGEYICSGAAFMRETFEERDQLLDAWTDYCNPFYMFWEAGSDPRQTDIRLIGMLHDISLEELYFKFARKEYGLSIEKLNEIYHNSKEDNNETEREVNDINAYENVSFSSPSTTELCRVIEVWTQEVKQRWQCRDRVASNQREAFFRVERNDTEKLNEILQENIRRKQMYEDTGVPEEKRAYITAELIVDKFWYYRFMSPDGRILVEGESPYDFHSHPFTVSLYPYVNGEIHPFMGVMIDQQRYINRLITMNDMSVRSSVKGVKFLPLSLKPDAMTVEEYANQFTEFDSSFVYDDRKAARTGAKPEFFTHSAFNIGTTEMLQAQMNLIHEISTVSGALQGKSPSAGTSATRYSMEAQNATTALYPLIKRFGTFKERVAMKKCQMMQQFYDDGRDVTRRNADIPLYYDREAARDIPFRISIKESAATPAYDMVMNDFLKDLFDRGSIPVEMYIKNSNLPYKEKLLQDLESYKQNMQQGNVPAQPYQVPGANQQLATQATQAIPNAVNQ